MSSVEILLAAYNGEKYISEQLVSILNQDTDNWHLTVSDDGSTDKTVEIVDSFVKKYPDKIKRVNSGKKFGNARDHFFWLMKQCEADYIQFCDQDDVWHPNKVRLLQEAMEQAESEYGATVPLLVFSDQAVVDRNLQLIAPSLMKLQQQDPKATDYRKILFQNIVTGCTMGINRSLAKMAGKCKEPEQTVMHDWWLALVAARFGQLIYISRSTIDYRQHSGNSVGAKDVTSLSYVVYKLLHLREFGRTVIEKKRQAVCFAECFNENLSEEERTVLRKFGTERSPLRFKLGYLKWINTPVRRVGFLVRW